MSDAELRDVVIHEIPSGKSPSTPEIPARLDDKTRLMSGDSPLEITKTLGVGERWSTLVVGAPGYAFATIDVDLGHGGDREIRLERGAELVLRVVGRPANVAARVEIRRIEPIFLTMRRRLDRAFREKSGATGQLADEPAIARIERKIRLLVEGPDPSIPFDADFAVALREGSPLRAIDVTHDEIRVRRLPAGHFGAVLVAMDGGSAHAAAAFDLFRTRTTTLELQWREVVPAATVAVSGTLEVPAAWPPIPMKPVLRPIPRDGQESAPPALFTELMPIDLPIAAPQWRKAPRVELVPTQDRGRFAWSATDLAPGRYGMQLPQWRCQLDFETGPSGASDVRLVVPSPETVDFTLIAEESGAPITTARIFLTGGEARRASGIGAEPLRFDAASATFRGPAPLGPVHFQIWPVDNKEFSIHDGRIEVVAGSNPVQVVLPPPTPVQIVLRDGDTIVPTILPDLVFERDDGRGSIVMTRGGDGYTQYFLDRPGRHRVRIENVRGYLDSEPVEVDLKPRELNRVEIPLRRAR